MKLLTILNGKLVVTDGDGEPLVYINSVEEFNAAALANGGSMLVSSSVDFPHEYTSDPAVIALATAIRS